MTTDPQRRLNSFRRAWTLPSIVESAAVLVSPLVAFFGLRLRLMPVPDLNDPAMHTTFIIDPQSIFLRYSAVFTPSARLREGARVAFLIPGRISYLLFGALPGFIVFRYVLALVAVVPAYLLLRRLYGRSAGAVAAIVILSSPVLITAWGTDFPDAAVVSYLVAALACLVMPSVCHRTMWLAISAVCFTLAVWSIATSAPVVIATLAGYGVVRLWREREHMYRDALVMVTAAVAVTGVLAVASGLLLGQFDYIIPTIRSVIYLSHKSLLAVDHSTSWRWAPYVAYLLAPPAIVAVGLVALGRRFKTMPTPQLVVGLACTTQLLVCVLLQFVGKVQILEVHYFSSFLWAGLSLLLAISLVQLTYPILDNPRSTWALPLLLLLVPLTYELDPHVPAFGWLPFGGLFAVLVVVFAMVASRFRLATPRPTARLATFVSVTLMSGCLLVLTVSPIPAHTPIPGTIFEPPPAYAAALGGGDAEAVGLYVVTADLPTFVGPATYSGEQLLIWWPRDEQQQILGPIGIYHAFFDSIPSALGTLSIPARQMIEQRQPAQILLLSFTGQEFAQSVTALAPFRPVLVRTAVLRSGPVALHVSLIDLDLYDRQP
ncbi:MAG TPA: glycosyltransferase family 39 protein [Candidatus Dormibacteraeota bacterium]